jgi:hypothetical protein
MTFPDDDLPDPRTAELLGGVPRAITPSRDLWPGIEGRLRRRGGETARWRVWTGGLVLAVAASILLTFTMLRREVTIHGARPSPESLEMQQVLNATTGPRSATAHSLARYLAVLDGAIAETEAALHETPHDPALTEFLQTLQRRRLTLLAQAARFAAES